MKAVSTLAGLALMAFGGWLLRVEMSGTTAHREHVYIAAGVIALGALVSFPDTILAALRNVVAFKSGARPTDG